MPNRLLVPLAAAALLVGCSSLPSPFGGQGSGQGSGQGGGASVAGPAASGTAGTSRSGAATARNAPRPDPDAAFAQIGDASYFTVQGAGTASGQRTDPNALTAAHPTLPLGSVVRVTSARTGRSVDVRIIDRGPTRPDRIIDLSRSAADRLGMAETGVEPVLVEAFLDAQPDPRTRQALTTMASR